MILRPLDLTDQPKPTSISAWEAVAATQRHHSGSYCLIRQPDHARLSGEIAARIVIAGTPTVTDEIVNGISLHDEGWAEFDSGHARLQFTPARYSDHGTGTDDSGKPLSFLEIKAGDFLLAWRGSIEAAESTTPIAGLIVSRHFYRLGKFGLDTGRYGQPDAELVRQFMTEQEERHERLSRTEKRTQAEIEYWTDILQFCDLLSLYLCCGSRENIEFPQRIRVGSETIKLRAQGAKVFLSPSMFSKDTACSVEAHSFPREGSSILRFNLR